MGSSRDKRRKQRKIEIHKKPKIENSSEVRPREPSIGTRVSPDAYRKETPVWRIGRIDNDGLWGWSAIRKQRYRDILIQHLSNRETMTWAEIEAQKHDSGKSSNHEIAVTKIIKEAQDRLDALNKNDTDVLFSMRVSNKIRIWGIREGRVFHILWFDLQHKICPSSRL